MHACSVSLFLCCLQRHVLKGRHGCSGDRRLICPKVFWTIANSLSLQMSYKAVLWTPKQLFFSIFPGKGKPCVVCLHTQQSFCGEQYWLARATRVILCHDLQKTSAFQSSALTLVLSRGRTCAAICCCVCCWQVTSNLRHAHGG